MAVEIRAATYAALRTALAAGTYKQGQPVFVEASNPGGYGYGAGLFQVLPSVGLTDDSATIFVGGSLAAKRHTGDAWAAYENAISFLDAPGKHPAFSHSRATVGALCQQFDGSFYQPEIGEIGSHGMRRLRNLLNSTATLATQGVTVEAADYWLSFTGTGSVAVSGVATDSLAGTGVGNRVSKKITAGAAGTATFTVTGSVTEAYLYKSRVGQTVADPEYVSRGVLSAPYHGWGIDGVRCFRTDEYGNDLTIGLGPELVTNGSFSADSDWTKGTGWSINAGVATSAGTNNQSNLSQAVSFLAGKQYQVTFTVSSVASGSFRVQLSGGGQVLGTERTSPGTYTEVLTVTTNLTTFGILSGGGAGAVGSIDNVSVREVYPVLAAGAVRNPAVTNLMPRHTPEDWSLQSVTTTEDDGWVLVGNNDTGSTAFCYTKQVITLTQAQQYTFAVDVEYVSGSGWVWLLGETYANLFAYFNVLTGALGSSTGFDSVSIESIPGSSGYRCIATFTKTTATAAEEVGVGVSEVNGTPNFDTTGKANQEQVRLRMGQLETGDAAHPVVQTFGAAVAVSADALSLDPTAFGYDQDGGVVVAVSTQFADSDDQQIVSAAGAAGESWSIGATHTVVDGGVTQASIADSWSAGDRVIHAVRSEANDVRVDADGANVGSDASATMPTITGLSLGGGSYSQAIEAIYYFPPGTVTDAQCLALSAGDLPTIPELA